MSDRFVSHYELIEEIGRGGMGVVYKARDTRLERLVALKFLSSEISANPQARQRFYQEARAISALEHRNICVIHDIDETDDGRLFLAMAYYAGESLRERIRRSPLAVPEAIGLALQIAEGLEHAHAKRVLHRDVKPGNVILTDRGEAKIVDFGLARLVDEPHLTKSGTMMGTLTHMSPEQARGEAVDHRTDVWSLGVVINEMITGRSAFAAKTEQMVLYALFHQEPDLSGIEARAPALAAVVRRCLEKDKSRRWATVGELISALRALDRPLTEAEIAFADLPTLSPGDSGSMTAVTPSGPPPALSEIVDPLFLAERPSAAFVGRDNELERLDAALHETLEGRGSVVLVSGEVGCGRTALVGEFCRRAERSHDNLVVSVGKCNAHGGAGDPYSPFRQVLAWLSGDFEASGSILAVGRERLERAWQMFPECVLALTEIGPALLDTFVPASGLFELISRLGESAAPLRSRIGETVAERHGSVVSPPQTALIDQFTRVVQFLARKQPQVIVLEDLHWIDAASAGLLSHLAGKLQGHRVLLIGTYRQDEIVITASEVRHPLTPVLNELKRAFGDIELRLGTEGGREFIDALLDTRPNRLGEDFREALHRQTRGMPLFTIELLRDMEESQMIVRDAEGRWIEGEEIDWERLPVKTEATLADRVDRLPEELLEMLAPASVQGERFSAEVVARVQEIEPRQAARRFSGDLDKRYRLVVARGVKRVDGQRLSEYGFRHILYQRYLYSRLDAVERSYLHEAIGVALEVLYGDRAHEVAVDLARHYQEAGLPDKAIVYHRQAATNAMRLSANLEATEHLMKALRLVPDLPGQKERIQQEFEIQTALGPALTPIHGFAAPEVERAYGRARELSEQVRDAAGFRVLWGLFAFYAVRGEFEKSLPLARQMLQTAELDGEAVQLAQALYVVGVTHFFRGELGRAGERLGEALGQEAPDIGDALAESFAQDSLKVAVSYEALIMWLQGDESQALIRSEQALANAREDMHPFTLSTVCLLSGFLHLLRRQAVDVARFAERVIDLSKEYQLFQVRDGSVLLACARVLAASPGGEGSDAADPAIDALRQALDRYRETGSQVFLPLYLAQLGDALVQRGRIEEALECLDQAGAAVEWSGERFWEAEIHRLRAEATLRTGERDEEGSGAQAHLEAALRAARAQGAITLEWRAAVSLARVWRDAGRFDDARRLLEECERRGAEEPSGGELDAARRSLSDPS